MIPVNIVKVSLDAEIRAVAIDGDICQRRRFWKPARCGQIRHRYAAGAHDFRSIEENHFIHNAGFEGGAVEFCARFQKNIQNLVFAKIAQDSVKVHVTAFGRNTYDGDSGAFECESFRGIEPLVR